MQENSRPRVLVTGAPARALSATCHVLHIALVAFVLVGWIIPVSSVLAAHLAFVPLLILTWLLNANSCPLNNIETWLAKGTWHDPEHREQGSFLVVLVENYLGLNPTQRQMDLITYALMALAWLLSWAHWWMRSTAP